MTNKGLPSYHIRFLGTGGSRFSVLRQLRASGGIWVSLHNEHWIIDPGPGSLVHIHDQILHANPEGLQGILLTHRHIDHSNDVNILAEAITQGGRVRRGRVILPEDAVFTPEPILFAYLREKIGLVDFWKEEMPFPFGEGGYLQGIRLIHHGVDCFGFCAYHPCTGHWGLISDTAFFPGLLSFFKKCRFLIINVTLEKSCSHLDHLSLEEARSIVAALRPDLALITHMGTRILEKGPENLIFSEDLSVFPAQDGMVVDLQEARIIQASRTQKEDCSHITKGALLC